MNLRVIVSHLLLHGNMSKSGMKVDYMTKIHPGNALELLINCTRTKQFQGLARAN